MNYDDIKDMTNEEAVVYFGVLTNTGIPCGDLENLLGWAGLAERNPVTGSWEGSLIDFMNSNVVPALGEGLRDLFSHLNKPRSETVDTTVHSWASEMDALLGGLLQVGVVTQLFIDDVIELGVGYVYPDLDVDAVQALRGSENVKDNWAKYDGLVNAHIVPVIDNPSSTDEDIAAACIALSNAWSN